MSIKFAVSVAAALILLLSSRAAAETPLPDAVAENCEDRSKCVLKLSNGAKTNTSILPPGFYLTPETYQRLDVEVKRLQTAETRLTAERNSYRESAKPQWVWLLSGFAVGAASVYYMTK